MFLKIIHLIGLTNLTEEKVSHYYDYTRKIRASRLREKRQKRSDRMLYSSTVTAIKESSILLKRYLIDTCEGVFVYALLLVTAKLTCLLSELLRIPGWAPVMKLLELVIIVCGSVACGLFVINNTNEYMKLIFCKDWLKRLLLFLRRFLW
jgi:hypothetical protein